jgi:predicted dehydrogenase
MKKVRIGLIGSGFMGRTHAIAFNNVKNIYEDGIEVEFVAVADVFIESAKKMKEDFDFERYTDNWKEVVESEDIDLIDITTPNKSHVEIAKYATELGKHVYCEKPLAMDGKEAEEAVQAVENNNVINVVGFNYIYNPVHQLAKKIIDEGKIGDVVSFRGTFDQDYYSEKDTMYSWRFSKEHSATGALGDLASHTISLSQYLVGDVERVCGEKAIFFTERPNPDNPKEMLPVENDDVVHFMYKYKHGGLGSITSNRVGCGRKLSLTYEIQGTKGSIFFDQEKMNELNLYYQEDDKSERGFKKILSSPGHGDFSKFFGGAGIPLGFSDLKIIEAHHVLDCIVNKTKPEVDFNFGKKVNDLIDGVLDSIDQDKWINL